MIKIKKLSFSKKNFIFGRNSVSEALFYPEIIEKILVSEIEFSSSLKNIFGKIKKVDVPVEFVKKSFLDSLTGYSSHQGILAFIKPKKFVTIDEILKIAVQRNEMPFIVICDKIQDPHNLGAILRTCECMGIHGVVIPKNRAADVNFTVNKTSAGASEHISVAKVTNISREIKYLKSKGLWIFGAESDGKVYYRENFKVPLVIVIGSEGYGISDLVRKNCDFIVKIPMFGKINSLNASNAAAILMGEISKQRHFL